MSERTKLMVKALMILAVFSGGLGYTVKRIALYRNIQAVGGEASPIVSGTEAYAKVDGWLNDLGDLGRYDEARALRELMRKGVLWQAPKMEGQLGLHVSTLQLVRRIYINEQVLSGAPVFLKRLGTIAADAKVQRAYAHLNMVGTLYHEYLHYAKDADEETAYAAELELYRAGDKSAFFLALPWDRQPHYRDGFAQAVENAKGALALERSTPTR